jgi:ferric-dicitrate binding protein FerR (iron transport regulator)
MSSFDPKYEWMRQYAEGTASSEITAKLEQALREDAAFRRLFLEYLNVDLALSNRAAYLEPAPEATVAPLRRRPWRAIRTWASVAAAAALLVGVSAWWLNRQPQRANDGGIAKVLDPYLAIVVDQSPEARWSGTHAPQGIGQALGRDRCRLESGKATLQLDNGVELLLQAPAELQLHSVDHGRLYHGRLSARVPDKATGFRMDVAGLNVVDLGTEFSLAVDGSGQPKVHVFKGKVLATIPSSPDSRTELTAGESARFDVTGGGVKLEPEDPLLFPALDDDTLLPRTTGDVRFLRRPPKSVKEGTFEHDCILVFEEKTDVALPQALAVLRGISFQQDGPQPSKPERVTLPAGTRVRSYYVHFDNVGRGVREVESKGSITFDQPVLGLVILNTALKQTDPWLACADTTYETDINRTLEMRFMGNKSYKPQPNISGRYDEVHLGADGHTVTMDLLASYSVDQFRILVSVADDQAAAKPTLRQQRLIVPTAETAPTAAAPPAAATTANAWSLAERDGRMCLLAPGGKPFLMLGISHAGGAFGKLPREDRVKLKDEIERELRGWGFNTVPAPEFWDRFPFIVPLDRLVGDQENRFEDVFDPAFKARLRKKIAAACEKTRGNPNCIGYWWTDIPPWSLSGPKKKRGKNWVEFIRDLPVAAPGRQRYEGFVKADGPHDDSAFLRLIARELYTESARLFGELDPQRLIFGERYNTFNVPDDVLKEAAKVVDVISVQPYEGTFSGATYDRWHRLTGKPIVISDWNLSFPTPEHAVTMWPQFPTPAAAAEAYEEYLRAAFTKPYILGYFKCQYVDQMLPTGMLKQGLHKQDGTTYDEFAGLLKAIHQRLAEQLEKEGRLVRRP